MPPAYRRSPTCSAGSLSTTSGGPSRAWVAGSPPPRPPPRPTPPAAPDPDELVRPLIAPITLRFLVTGEPIDETTADNAAKVALAAARRSEEHTSELQSLRHLVCR